MVLIAIAGGTSPTLGSAIISALHKTPNTPLILSRKPPPNTPSPPTTTLYGAPIRHVDYASPTSLATALADVHTLISLINPPSPRTATTIHLALLAAAKAAGVRRFAPAEFGFGCPSDMVAVTAGRDEVWRACEESGLECARFRCGMFMNYLGVGRGFEGGEEARVKAVAGLEEGEGVMFWDFASGVAEVPVREGDGGAPRVTLTEIDDVGRLVAAACGLTEGTWVGEMGMVGETIGVGEVVGLVREVLGKRLEVRRVTRGELEERVEAVEGVGGTREAVVRKMMAQFALVVLEEREGWGIIRPVVNGMCYHTKPMSVREYLTNYQ